MLLTPYLALFSSSFLYQDSRQSGPHFLHSRYNTTTRKKQKINGESNTERDRQTDRDRQRQRQTDRGGDRERDRDRQIEGETGTERDRQRQRQTDRQTDSQRERESKTETARQTDSDRAEREFWVFKKRSVKKGVITSMHLHQAVRSQHAAGRCRAHT